MSPRQTSGRRAPQSRPAASGQPGSGRAEPLKFEGEFDFEQANARFEQEIEKEFTDKLKLGDKHQSQQQQRNRHHSKEQLDSSLTNTQSLSLQDMQDQQHMLMKQKTMGTTTTTDDHKDSSSSSSHHHHMPNPNTMSAEEKNFYDKNISFFDRISCESSDKLQTKERKNWKEERKMNAETFGLVQRQAEMKSANYARNYGNNNNRYNQSQQQGSAGRNYPRNYNSSGQQQSQQQYRGNNNNNNMRQQQPQSQQQRMAVGSGMGQRNNNNNNYRRNDMDNNSNNYRRNDMDVSYSRGSQRRFGSR